MYRISDDHEMNMNKALISITWSDKTPSTNTINESHENEIESLSLDFFREFHCRRVSGNQ